MLQPTRTVLALAAGTLTLGLLGAGVSAADTAPVDEGPASVGLAAGHPGGDEYDSEGYHRAYGKVVSKGPLSVRSHPTTHSYLLGKVHPHRKLALECKTRGQKVDGNDLWYLLDLKRHENGDNGTEPLDGMRESQDGDASRSAAEGHKGHAEHRGAWVSARYVKNLTPVKWCRF
ncbi:hypothetical protein [Streptomyces sp. NPDC048606]|uniref:hypothetical protein n=1 Tax=Streptomyces sp. NPDC048606 TaxID=3154726 RepID=UPI00344A6D19